MVLIWNIFFSLILLVSCGKESGNAKSSSFSNNVDLSNSIVSASSTTGTADGSTRTEISVTVIDKGNGLGIEGKKVILNSSRSYDTISPSSTYTGSNGGITFYVTTTVAGQSKYTASIVGTNETIKQTATVTYSAAAIRSNLKLWLRPEAFTNIIDGSSISSWTDSSGNGNDASQSTVANEPVFKANAINSSYSTLQFDGTNDYLSTSLALTSPYVTVIAVYDYTGACGAGNSHRAVSGSNNWFVGPYDGAINAFFGTSYVTGGCLAASTFIIHSVVSSGSSGSATGYAYSDGTLLGSVSDGIAPGTITIGGRGGTEGLNGQIAEILIYDTALSTSEISSVESYLNTKYSVY